MIGPRFIATRVEGNHWVVFDMAYREELSNANGEVAVYLSRNGALWGVQLCHQFVDTYDSVRGR